MDQLNLILGAATASFALAGGYLTVLLRRAELETGRLREEHGTAVAMASHELRGAVQCISGYAALLLRKTEANRPAIQAIARESERLERLTQDLIDRTRLDRASLTLHPVACNLAQLLQDELAYYRSVSGREIYLSLPQRPVAGCWDQLRITQVLRNLLGNSVKYATPGTPIGIAVRLTLGAVELSVRNRTDSLQPDDVPALFERCHRHARHQHLPGVGLGLYVSRAIAQQHGGDMGASVCGDVIRFWLRLPLDLAPTAEEISALLDKFTPASVTS